MSDEDLDLLRANARETETGRWSFEPEGWESTAMSYDAAGAVAIVRFCLTLGVPVRPVLTGEAMLKIAEKLTALETRVANLESPLGRLS